MGFSGYFDKSHRSTDQIRLDVFKVHPAITSTCRENVALLVAFRRNTDQNEGFQEHSETVCIDKCKFVLLRQSTCKLLENCELNT